MLVNSLGIFLPQLSMFSRSQVFAGQFRDRLARGEDLDALLPEAFAVVREAARRVLDMRHFDVQLVRRPLGREMVVRLRSVEQCLRDDAGVPANP